MKSLRLLVLTAFLSSPAWAVVSVVQDNVQVPTTGSLTPFDFLNDGTNSWPLIDIFDGTTHGTFNADGGLATHLNNTSVAVTGTFWQTTQPISAASLPLPTGAATAANQTGVQVAQGGATAAASAVQSGGVFNSVAPTLTTGQGAALQLTAAGSLHATVDNTNPNGQTTMSASAPVVIASDQSAVATKAASGAFVAGSIADLAHGQGTMAASVPVAIASNQSAVPISAASLPLPTGAATSANQPSNAAIGSTTSGQTGGLTMGAVTTAAPTYTTAQTNPLSLTTAGALRTDSSATTQPISAASLPLPSGAATSALQSTINTTLGSPMQNSGGTVAVTQSTAANLNATVVGTGTFAVQNTPASQYPGSAVAVQGSATGTTGATSTTLAATVSVTNFVCQISIRANATAAATGNATLSDGTKTFNFTQWTAPNASGVGIVEETFSPCYPAAATNTAWTLTSAAPGTGGVVSVAISGYQK